MTSDKVLQFYLMNLLNSYLRWQFWRINIVFCLAQLSLLFNDHYFIIIAKIIVIRVQQALPSTRVVIFSRWFWSIVRASPDFADVLISIAQ